MSDDAANFTQSPKFQTRVELEVASIIRARAHEEAVAELLRRIDNFGPDVFDENAVLRFVCQFKDGMKCTYAAIKVNERWYLTGKNTTPLTWIELATFICSTKASELNCEVMVPAPPKTWTPESPNPTLDELDGGPSDLPHD